MEEMKVLQKTERLHEARWWEPEAGGKVHCYLCPRHCHIHAGQAGFCFIRVNRDGKLYSLGYGAPAALQIDPIEKKPLNHFLPGTRVFSMGTAGCNMGCFFCQNWDISKSHQDQVHAQNVPPEDVPKLARKYGCASLAFTYNEPTIWGEYVIDICRAAKGNRASWSEGTKSISSGACLGRQAKALESGDGLMSELKLRPPKAGTDRTATVDLKQQPPTAGTDPGLKTVMVSNGYITHEAFRDIYPYIDAANIDLKAFTENFYGRITLTHLQPVLETLEWLKNETKVWFEITNLMIPTLNDDPAETRKLAEWILEHLGPDVPLHFTAFHPDFKLMDKPRTPPETLHAARKIAREAGLHYVYEGNIFGDGGNTACPQCGTMLIQRSWHDVLENRLAKGKCPKCGLEIPGVWEKGGSIQRINGNGEIAKRYEHLNL